jgi:hypothetical protein
MPSLVANQVSIRDATWEIQAELSSLKRKAGADIDTPEVKTVEASELRQFGPRLNVWNLISLVWNPILFAKATSSLS